MVFSSITFLFYFLPVVLGFYYLVPANLKNTILLAASLFFYAWGEPVYIVLMVCSVLFNYAAGLFLARRRTVRGQRRVLLAAVFVNLLLLGFFKYADFLIENLNAAFGTALAPLELPLPVGISFYTFQALSYIIDLYRGRVRVQRNLIDFAAYIAMFPQLIAGPIVRLSSIEDSLHRRSHSTALFAQGVRRFIVGLAKKALLANQAGLLWDAASALPREELTVLSAWLGILGFTFQIYFDFSGYSDMAIGLGRMLGFNFPENFDHPYTARSVTEFWRRWHISLGTWFREYVYIPLGGNRCGKMRQLLNILIVWLLTGLWHGAGWNFLLWGLYFALLLAAEKLFLLRWLARLPRAVQHGYTMLLVVVSWVFFANDAPQRILAFLTAMFGFGGAGAFSAQSGYLLMSNFGLLVVLTVASGSLPLRLYRKLADAADGRRTPQAAEQENSVKPRKGANHAAVFRAVVENLLLAALFLLSVAEITAGTYNPFLYFRF